jgi:hypothetical protein
MLEVINWFDAYRIDHKIEYVDGKPARVIPMDKLNAHKTGHQWFVNGRIVSRKFIKALQAYYG